MSKNRWVSEAAGRDGVGMWFFISNNNEHNYGEMIFFCNYKRLTSNEYSSYLPLQFDFKSRLLGSVLRGF